MVGLPNSPGNMRGREVRKIKTKATLLFSLNFSILLRDPMLNCVAFSVFAALERFSPLLFQVKGDGRGELDKEKLI